MKVSLDQYWAAGIPVEEAAAETGESVEAVQKVYDDLNYQMDAALDAVEDDHIADMAEIATLLATRFKPVVSHW